MFLTLLTLLTPSRAQESLRQSLAGEQAASDRQKAASTLGYYNLKLGPVSANFAAGVGIEADDNITLIQYNPKEDIIFRPELDARMVMPVSDLNNLHLTMGVGYLTYARHSNLDRPFIAPNSELSFDIYVKDIWVNLHDRFSILDIAYLDPTVVGVGNYEQLQNAIGASATWDLNKVIAKFGYDHVNYAFLVSVTGSSPPSSDAEVFSTSAGYMLRNTVQAGLEAGGSLIHFTGGSNTNLSNATQWNLGSFVEARYSEHLRFRLSAGYTMYSQSENTSTTGTALSGVYGQAVISHQVSRMLDYYLYGGRVISLSYYGGTVNDSYLRLQANWHFLRKITLTTGFDYDNGSQFYTIAENFSRYGLRFAVARQITRKLTATLTYQFYDRSSNLEGNNYTANVGNLALMYQF